MSRKSALMPSEEIACISVKDDSLVHSLHCIDTVTRKLKPLLTERKMDAFH